MNVCGLQCTTTYEWAAEF